MYDRLAVDFNVDADLDYGMETHRLKVWALARHCKVWQTILKGPTMKLVRWGSWYIAQEELRAGRHTLLLGLILIGIDQGWWPSVAQSPLFRISPLAVPAEELADGADDEDAPAEAPPAADGEELQRQTVAGSNKEIAAMKSKCHNQMHFSAMVLANPVGAQLVDLLCEASRLIRLDFWQGIKDCSNRAEARKRDISLALGEGVDVLAQTLGLFHDATSMSRIGFYLDHQFPDEEAELLTEETGCASIGLCGLATLWLVVQGASALGLMPTRTNL